MVLAMCRQHTADKMQTKTNVKSDGNTPERAKVAGRFSMAGPVSELTAMETLPRLPMVPI